MAQHGRVANVNKISRGVLFWKFLNRFFPLKADKHINTWMLLKSIKANLLRREQQSPLANLFGGNQVCIELDLSRINWTDLSNRYDMVYFRIKHGYFLHWKLYVLTGWSALFFFLCHNNKWIPTEKSSWHQVFNTIPSQAWYYISSLNFTSRITSYFRYKHT